MTQRQVSLERSALRRGSDGDRNYTGELSAYVEYPKKDDVAVDAVGGCRWCRGFGYLPAVGIGS